MTMTLPTLFSYLHGCCICCLLGSSIPACLFRSSDKCTQPRATANQWIQRGGKGVGRKEDSCPSLLPAGSEGEGKGPLSLLHLYSWYTAQCWISAVRGNLELIIPLSPHPPRLPAICISACFSLKSLWTIGKCCKEGHPYSCDVTGWMDLVTVCFDTLFYVTSVLDTILKYLVACVLPAPFTAFLFLRQS